MPLPSRDKVKDDIAAEIASGCADLATIATARGYTLEGFKRLVASEDMRQRIERARSHVELQARLLRVRLLSLAPRMLENIARTADDPGHKDSFSAAKFIVEKITGAPDQQINVNVNVEVLERIGYFLDQIRKEARHYQSVVIEKSENVTLGGNGIESNDDVSRLLEETSSTETPQ